MIAQSGTRENVRCISTARESATMELHGRLSVELSLKRERLWAARMQGSKTGFDSLRSNPVIAPFGARSWNKEEDINSMGDVKHGERDGYIRSRNERSRSSAKERRDAGSTRRRVARGRIAA